MAAVAWIENINITIPLTHMRYRTQTMSMELPVMYNSTTALIMYYTFIEVIGSIWNLKVFCLPLCLETYEKP